MALKKQRAKRLSPCFYASRKLWVVDILADMNDGNRGRKFYETYANAVNKRDAVAWWAL